MEKEELRLSPTLKSIGEYALQKCKIRSIVLPGSVISIGKLAFYASEIESIVLPDGLRSMPLGIFQQCQNLTSVTLGSDCEALSDYCFDGCPLQHLYVNAVIPPVCQSNTFSGARNILPTVSYMSLRRACLYIETTLHGNCFNTLKLSKLQVYDCHILMSQLCHRIGTTVTSVWHGCANAVAQLFITHKCMRGS